MRIVAIMLAAALLSGCCGAPRYTQEPLPLPERPELPRVPASAWIELCVTGDGVSRPGQECAGRLYTAIPIGAYADLAERDAALRGHVERLEGIILTTHGDGEAE